jgi:RNA polymerase sigma factor for flagellar operon FliA
LKKITGDELKALLVTAIQELPDRERSILVLHYHEGIMFNEIAAAMNVSESRISQLHTRALDRLKRSLTQTGTSSPDSGAELERTV